MLKPFLSESLRDIALYNILAEMPSGQTCQRRKCLSNINAERRHILATNQPSTNSVVLQTAGAMVSASNTDLLVQVPIVNEHGVLDRNRSFKMKSSIYQHVQRAGSGNSVFKGTVSLKDKLSKFKDAAFLRNLSNSSTSKLDSLSDHMRTSIHICDLANKRQVRFAKSTENIIYEIEPLSDLQKEDIWWTMDELSASRSKVQVASLTDKSVQNYVSVFDQAKQEVFTSRKLSSEIMRELVTGLAKGYLGIEAMVRNNQRGESIRDYVVSVVRYFREQSIGESTLHFHDSVCSFSSQNSNSTSNFNSSVRDYNVRKYAANLSAGNRHFARAMGNAEYLAAIRECQENRNSNPSRTAVRKTSM